MSLVHSLQLPQKFTALSDIPPLLFVGLLDLPLLRQVYFSLSLCLLQPLLQGIFFSLQVLGFHLHG